MMSRDVFELVLAFEREFGFNVPGSEAWRLSTPRGVTEYVWAHITHEQLTKEQLAAWVRAVVEEQTALEGFHDDAHFVRDLGLYC